MIEIGRPRRLPPLCGPARRALERDIGHAVARWVDEPIGAALVMDIWGPHGACTLTVTFQGTLDDPDEDMTLMAP